VPDFSSCLSRCRFWFDSWEEKRLPPTLRHVLLRMTIANRHPEKKFGRDSDARIEHRRICRRSLRRTPLRQTSARGGFGLRGASAAMP